MAKKDHTGVYWGLGIFLGGLYMLNRSTGIESPLHSISPGTTLSPTDWVKAMFPFAQAAESVTGVPALLSVAQSAIETGYGKHAPGNNFFGIKAGKSWNGAIQLLPTWECGDTGDAATDKILDDVIQIFPPGDPNGFASCNSRGKYSYRVNGKFRKYNSPIESFTDHGLFLKNNARYAAAFTTDTIEDFAREMVKAKYATAPNYIDVLLKEMQQVNTMLAD